jgi:hypothetical protein
MVGILRKVADAVFERIHGKAGNGAATKTTTPAKQEDTK